MVTIKATIFFEKKYWVGTFERTDKEGYAIARYIFGSEPTDPEIYDFIIKNYQELNFGKPQEFQIKIKRMNPKRLQREVRREMEKFKETAKPSTLAQEVMREELEKKKLQKKRKSSREKHAEKERQFSLKQEKKKKKQRGH